MPRFESSWGHVQTKPMTMRRLETKPMRRLEDPRGFTCRWCLKPIQWRWIANADGTNGRWVSWVHDEPRNVWCLYGVPRQSAEAQKVLARAVPFRRQLQKSGSWMGGPAVTPAERCDCHRCGGYPRGKLHWGRA